MQILKVTIHIHAVASIRRYGSHRPVVHFFFLFLSPGWCGTFSYCYISAKYQTGSCGLNSQLST
uniref:Uncharacterized protein n=1 Tax=Anguilla anguilla TaxID=7936 RepID=A0A0E9W1X4_ANGAN